MTEEKRVELTDDDVVVAVQCDAVRLIGHINPEKDGHIMESGSLKYPFTLKGVGAILITRGVSPGAIQGTVNQVKQINIATLDYSETALAEVGIERASLIYTDLMLDEGSRAHMREAYEEFINRKMSIIQHSRLDGALP